MGKITQNINCVDTRALPGPPDMHITYNNFAACMKSWFMREKERFVTVVDG